MLSSFDVQQTSPLPRPHQIQKSEWYERQQPANDTLAVRHVSSSIASQNFHYDQGRSRQNVTVQLRSLQQYYTILDGNLLVIELLEEEVALYRLLLEAVRPLQSAFGAGRIIHLRVLTSDDDRLIKVAVQLPADFGDDPERALHSFDTDWWLGNCHRSGGALVFDYEIQDAV
jgi:hypothetical protein